MSFDLSAVSRSQMGVLFALAAVVAMVLVVVFLVSPMKQREAVVRRELDSQVARSTRALDGVRSITRMDHEVERLTAYLLNETNRFVIRPVLGSYPVQRDLYRLAAASSFKITALNEIGRQPTPGAEPKAAAKPAKGAKAAKGAKLAKTPGNSPERAFDRYLVELTGEASYAETFALIEQLEQANPYCGVTALTITGVANRPEIHRVNMSLEWPVAADDADGNQRRGR